ncbi:MAG: ABC transporter substrate-binding protein [Dehalococcoidia bacterium]
MAGAALLGCSSSAPPPEPAASATARAARTAAPEPAPSVAAGDVRLTPGSYRRILAPTAAEANPSANAIPGGTLVDRYLDPTTMDINRTLSCTVQHTMNLTNSRLTRVKVGAGANAVLPEIEPDLASSWEATPDNLEFTFHLRKGVKTHNVAPANGRDLTSEDVRLSLERYRAGGSQKDVFAEVASIDAPDASTVRVRLASPRVDLPTDLAAWCFIWLKELVEDDNLIQTKAVGSGPFIQEEWTKQERSVFRKHPDYYETGRPYIDRYVAHVQNDLSAQAKGFADNTYAFWTALDDSDTDSMGSRVNDMVMWTRPRSRGSNTNGWQFQMRSPSFRDERVRRAISLAIDRTKIDESRNAGDNANPEGPYSNAPLPWPFLFDGAPTGKANGRYYAYDPKEASRLMQAAGFSKERPLRWSHVTWYDREASGEIIPSLNGVLPEVKVELKQIDSATQVAALADRSFQETTGIVWGPPGNSVDQWLYPWYHSKGGLNYGSKGNDDLDKLLDQQRRESNLESRKATWQKIWTTIHEQVWDLWWPEAHLRSAWHNWVLNYRPHGLLDGWVCYANHNLSSMWLDKDAPQRKTP